MAATNLAAHSDAQLAPASSPSLVLENGRLIKPAAPGVAYGVIMHNTGPAQFLHVYDSAAAAANGAIPLAMAAVAAGATVALDFGVLGLGFTTGLFVGNSTTPATRTAGAADCLFYPRFR